jgi:hypothetical protein
VVQVSWRHVLWQALVVGAVAFPFLRIGPVQEREDAQPDDSPAAADEIALSFWDRRAAVYYCATRDRAGCRSGDHASRRDAAMKLLSEQLSRTRADVPDADFHGRDLSALRVREPNHWNDANLSRSDLSGANLRGLSLRHATLEGAVLSGADLRDADLSYANLDGANLSSAQLEGAIFLSTHANGADFSGATGLGQTQFEGVLGAPLHVTLEAGGSETAPAGTRLDR